MIKSIPTNICLKHLTNLKKMKYIDEIKFISFKRNYWKKISIKQNSYNQKQEDTILKSYFYGS